MVIGPSFNVKGIEPSGVRSAPLADRQAFWAAVSGFVIAAKADELAAGLDRFGNAFVPLRPKTIKYRRSEMGPADPNAPALQPAHGLSRTRSLFTVETTDQADGLVCFWAFDSVTGESWGEILNYHRYGSGNLPVRDVFGLSPQSLGIVKRRASDWWRGYVLGGGVSISPSGPPMPTGRPNFTPTGSGWGRVTPLPGTGPRTRNENLRRQIKQGNHVYTLQGGMGLSLPPAPAGPPVYRNKTPKPPALPNAREIRTRAKVKPPRPTPPPTPTPEPVPVITLPVFASSVLAAARAVPDAVKYSEGKVWIIDVYDAYVARNGPMSVVEFKAQLVEAHRAGLLTLSRFDLPGQLSKADRAKDAASTVTAGVAEWNQIRI